MTNIKIPYRHSGISTENSNFDSKILNFNFVSELVISFYLENKQISEMRFGVNIAIFAFSPLIFAPPLQ